MLRAGEPTYWDRPPLPYELELDRQRVEYGRRRRSRVGIEPSDGDGAVIDLERRRPKG